MRNIWLLSISFALAACANPYQKFCQSAPNGADARSIPTYDASVASIQIYSTNDFNRDIRALVQKGYAVVSQAAFNAGADRISVSNVRSQVEEVGAHVVLVSSQYSHTVSGAILLAIPHTQTSYTTGSVTAYGPYGSARGPFAKPAPKDVSMVRTLIALG